MIEPTKNITLFSNEQAWLTSRQISWVEEYEHSWSEVDNLPYIQARCDYFFSGNLKSFMDSEQRPCFLEIILYSPEEELEPYIANISQYCEWVINSEVTWGNINKDNLNDNLFEVIIAVLRENSHIPVTVVADLFTYFFGKQFDKKREVTLTLSSDTKIFSSPITANKLSSTLKFYITRYMYEVPEERAINAMTSKFLIDYYFSVAENVDERVFSTSQIKEIKIGGVIVNEGAQRGYRWLIARMLGYITEYEEEDDVDEWFVNDELFEAEFKKRWNECNWPPAYYKLVEFIHKHKEQCLFEND